MGTVQGLGLGIGDLGIVSLHLIIENLDINSITRPPLKVPLRRLRSLLYTMCEFISNILQFA
jgi:hypothetical protein